jgi:hypothetical protein
MKQELIRHGAVRRCVTLTSHMGIHAFEAPVDVIINHHNCGESPRVILASPPASSQEMDAKMAGMRAAIGSLLQDGTVYLLLPLTRANGEFFPP